MSVVRIRYRPSPYVQPTTARGNSRGKKFNAHRSGCGGRWCVARVFGMVVRRVGCSGVAAGSGVGVGVDQAQVGVVSAQWIVDAVNLQQHRDAQAELVEAHRFGEKIIAAGFHRFLLVG